MAHLPEDPLTPASRTQILVAGVASLITGIAFLVFAALTVQITSASGRIGLPSVILLIAVMVVIGGGFLDVAVAVLRKRAKRRPYLLSSTTLYLVGGFLLIIPILLVGLSILNGSEDEALSILKVLSISSIGLLAIRLAHIRRKRSSTTS